MFLCIFILSSLLPQRGFEEPHFVHFVEHLKRLGDVAKSLTDISLTSLCEAFLNQKDLLFSVFHMFTIYAVRVKTLNKCFHILFTYYLLLNLVTKMIVVL